MKTIKHIQSLLVIIIACMTLGSCNNELDVTKSFPFTVETMPVSKELSQGETIEIPERKAIVFRPASNFKDQVK